MMHVEWYGVLVFWLLRYVLTKCFMFILICALFIVLGFVLMYVVWFVLFRLSGIYIYIIKWSPNPMIPAQKYETRDLWKQKPRAHLYRKKIIII